MPAGGESMNPIDWAVRIGAADTLLRITDAYVRRNRRRRTLLLVSGVLAALFTGFLWREQTPASEVRGGAPMATLIMSAPSHQVLPDGSEVELKDNAEISVDFRGTNRRVYLRHGEAHFKVAHDLLRPFVVVAGGFQVEAVGTAFSVERGVTAVDVLVTEGRVAVEESSPVALSLPPQQPTAQRPRTLVDAGSRLVVESGMNSEPRARSLSRDEINECMAWRVPRLEFSGTPLQEILPLVTRYSGVRMILSDPELGRIRLSGTMRADNVEMLLALLEEGHRISTRRVSATEIVLREVR